MKNKCFEKIPGFMELVKTNDLKICFLHDPEVGYKDAKPKAPEGRTQQMINEYCLNFLEENGVSSFEELGIDKGPFIQSINGKYNYRSVEEANLYKNIDRNLGITFPNDADEKESFWVCLDIDGQDYGYMVKGDRELKIGTRHFLFLCIKKGLQKRNIDFLCCKTMNDGYHLYFKTKKAKFKDHGFNSFTYPSSEELIKSVYPTAFQDFPVLKSLVGTKMANGSIEMFTKGKYTVAPGSVIDGKEYALLSDGVQDFRDVSVYEDGYLEDLIFDILKEDCYFAQETVEEKKETNVFQNLISDEKQILSQTNIKNIGDFIIYAFQHISGQKHYATLALGGFLYNQNISQSSIQELSDYIIDNAPDGLFKGSKENERTSGFGKVLIHDSVEDTEKKKTGLTTLKDIFKDTKVPIREMTKILWTNSAPSFHKFNPNGISASTYKEVVIDFENKETWAHNLKSVVDDDGTVQPPKRLSSHLIRHVLSDINYIDNISAAKISRKEQMPISFYIQSRLEPNCLYICENTEEMIEGYNSLPLAHQKGSNEILSMVIDEYESIGLIGVLERSTIPGIYLSRDKKDLRRFIYKEGEIVEVFPEPPSKDKLRDALLLLKRINETYPWYDDKFAVFTKLGMLLPYGYIFKSEYGSFIRGIILYGEAGTCKSSASEMIEYMNVPKESIEAKELEYILPGSEFATPYRMGKALSLHSYPIMVEEVENVFEDAENRDLIKNSITRKFIRNPGGDKEYYSRSIPIFSANELSDEIEKSGMFRRFLILNFVSGERGDKEEVEESLSFLNENGVRNSKFKDLYIISEFVFYDLHNHLDYFSYTPQQIIDAVLRDMSEYVGLDLSWLIEPKFDKYYQTDRVEEDQADLIMVLDTLKYYFKNSIKLSGVASNVSEQFLENLIEDKYPYIYRIKNQKTNGVMITSDFNKSYKRNYPEAKKISLNRLAELLNEGLNLRVEIKQARMKPSNLKKRIAGLYMDWIDFCNIFNIKVDDVQEVE